MERDANGLVGKEERQRILEGIESAEIRKAIVRFLGHLRTKQFGGTLLTQDDLAIELQRKATIPEQWLEVDGEYIFALIWHVPFDIPQSETLVDIDKCRDAAQELSKATTHIRQDVPRVCRLYLAAI